MEGGREGRVLTGRRLDESMSLLSSSGGPEGRNQGDGSSDTSISPVVRVCVSVLC